MLVLVAGATGATGALVVRALRERGLRVRCAVRDPRRAEKLLARCGDAEFVQADLQDAAALSEALRGVDLVVCAAGSRVLVSPCVSVLAWAAGAPQPPGSAYWSDYVGVRNLVAAAREARVRHFVLVSSAAVTRAWSPMSLLLNAFLGGVMHWKLEGERALRASGLAYTIVRPTALNSSLDARAHAPELSQGDTVHGRVGREHVALACVIALSHPRARNATFEINWRLRPLAAGEAAPPLEEAFAALRPDNDNAAAAAAPHFPALAALSALLALLALLLAWALLYRGR